MTPIPLDWPSDNVLSPRETSSKPSNPQKVTQPSSRSLISLHRFLSLMVRRKRARTKRRLHNSNPILNHLTRVCRILPRKRSTRPSRSPAHKFRFSHPICTPLNRVLMWKRMACSRTSGWSARRSSAVCHGLPAGNMREIRLRHHRPFPYHRRYH